MQVRLRSGWRNMEDNRKICYGPSKYPMEIDARKVSLFKRIIARILGYVKLYKDYGFKRPENIYLGYCGRHKIYFLDYMHGYEPFQYIDCPYCQKEFFEELDKRLKEN